MVQASSIDGAPTRAAIVAEAKAWLGTPYHHQASVKGVGCDCLGLIRGVRRAFFGADPEPIPAYSGDWSEASGDEAMLNAAQRHFEEIDIAAAGPSDILLFRWKPHLPAKHAGILIGATRMIHAYERVGVVAMTLTPWWRKRVAAAFAFAAIGGTTAIGNRRSAIEEAAAADATLDPTADCPLPTAVSSPEAN